VAKVKAKAWALTPVKYSSYTTNRAVSTQNTKQSVPSDREANGAHNYLRS